MSQFRTSGSLSSPPIFTLMSFPGVMEIVGTLQLVSTCALAAYAIAAWRRKRPESKNRSQTGSVPQALKLLSDLQRLPGSPPPWKLRSPLAKVEAELWRQGELLRLGAIPDPSSALSVSSASISDLTASSRAPHLLDAGPQPLSSVRHSYVRRHG